MLASLILVSWFLLTGWSPVFLLLGGTAVSSAVCMQVSLQLCTQLFEVCVLLGVGLALTLARGLPFRGAAMRGRQGESQSQHGQLGQQTKCTVSHSHENTSCLSPMAPQHSLQRMAAIPCLLLYQYCGTEALIPPHLSLLLQIHQRPLMGYWDTWMPKSNKKLQ